MRLGIGCHFDVEPVAGLLADERDQFVRVAELAGIHGARRQVAAQRDDVADAVGLVLLEDRGDVLARRSDAGQMGSRLVTGGLDLDHRLERPVAGRTTGAEGHREELRLELGELFARRAQLGHALGRLGGEEFEAERPIECALVLHVWSFNRPWWWPAAANPSVQVPGTQDGGITAPARQAGAVAAISSGTAPACTDLPSARRCSGPACRSVPSTAHSASSAAGVRPSRRGAWAARRRRPGTCRSG